MSAFDAHAARFATTRWGLVSAAGRKSDPESRLALEELCSTYWYPLYAYTRRSGHRPEDASDLVQGFFASLLARDDLRDLPQAGGRFRDYLLGALRHHMANEREHASALKRGGGHLTVSLTPEDAEKRYALEPASPGSPEMLFERKWALTVLENALARLKAEQEAKGRGALFERLRSFLVAGGTDEPRINAATDLGLSSNAASVAVHRLRRRYGELVLDEVAATVDRPQDVEDELRRLFEAVSS